MTFELQAPRPSFVRVLVLWVLVLIGLMASFRLSRDYLPLICFLRVVVFLLGVSLLACQFLPERVNRDAGQLLSDLLGVGAFLICFLPVIHALVLYIFPLRWPMKLLASVVAMGFVVISILLQAGAMGLLVLHGSSVWLLVVYMLGTFLPQLIIQLTIYGYFMSLARSPKLV